MKQLNELRFSLPAIFTVSFLTLSLNSSSEVLFLDYVHQCNLKTIKCEGGKILACVHTIPVQFENSRKFDDKCSLQSSQEFDVSERYLHLKNRSTSF